MALFGSTTVIFFVSFIIVLAVLYLYIRRKKYATRSKEVSVFVDFMTILIGVASILAAFVSIDVMRSQEKLQEKLQNILLDIQKKEHQPVFYVRQSLSKSTPNGVYDIEDYYIESFGGYMASPAKIEHQTMICVYYRDNSKPYSEGIKMYYPVIYYNGGIDYKNISGLLYKTVGSEYLKNNLCFNRIYKAAIEHDRNNNVYTEVKKIELSKISYIDIYGDNRNVYYIDSQQTTKEEYDVIMTESKKYLFETKSIDKLTFDDILNIIESLK